FPRMISAYSLVTAPDFFPAVSQRELLEWTKQSVPSRLRATVWAVPPLTLADTRRAPNVTLAEAGFRKDDVTVTAVVSTPMIGTEKQTKLIVRASRRHQHLPDAAAGEFAPGWDVSVDRLPDGTK